MDKKHMSVRQRWNAGKGSRYRPVDKKKFDENYDRIFGKDKDGSKQPDS